MRWHIASGHSKILGAALLGLAFGLPIRLCEAISSRTGERLIALEVTVWAFCLAGMCAGFALAPTAASGWVKRIVLWVAVPAYIGLTLLILGWRWSDLLGLLGNLRAWEIVGLAGALAWGAIAAFATLRMFFASTGSRRTGK